LTRKVWKDERNDERRQLVAEIDVIVGQNERMKKNE
jgi:hypothetical protein